MAILENSDGAGWRKRVTAYVFAVVISVLTLEARLALTPWLGDRSVLILFVLPIIFSAYIGGLWAGLLSTTICAAGIYYCLLAQAHNILFFEGSAELWQWVMLMVIGGLISLLVEGLHRSRRRIETASRSLSESQALYHSLVEQMPAGIFRKDAAGRYVFVNPFFCQLRGISPDQFLGKLPSELAESEGDLKVVAAEHHDQIMRTGKTVEAMDEFHHRDGRTLYFHVVKTPVFDANGKIVGSQGILFDVTQRKQEAAALATSVALLRTTMEATNNGLLVVDTNNRVTVFNSRFLELMDIPRDVAEAADDSAVLELARQRVVDPEEFLCRVKEHYANPEKVSFDILKLKNGKVVERVSHPQRLGDKIIGRVWSFRDITDRRKAEKAVLDRERLLRQVIDLVPHFIFAKDRESRYLLVNRACAEAHGLTVEAMTGQRNSEFMDDQAQAEAFMSDDREVIDSGRPKFIPEERLTLKDGSVRILETIKMPFTMPGQSGPAVLGVAVDITARKAAEQQLEQMAVIVESSEEAIIGSDLAGGITSWNRGAENVFGYSAAEIVGQSALLLCPMDLHYEQAEILGRIGRGEGLKQQTDRLRKDGKRIRISATISPLKGSQGQVIGAAMIARDITRQQMLEEQLRQSQKMEAIGQLAGGVAHDFNNILAVIQMQIELAKMDGHFTAEQEMCLGEIETAARRGANLTRQLLLFSRRQRLQPRELDLSDSITSMTKMLRRILGEDIQIQFKYASQPLFVLADAGMIDQILMNLTLNSRDAMPGGGHLIIETAAVEMDELAVVQSMQGRPGSFVRLGVSDTGSGIPPDVLPRIFEPFFTTKDVGKGTGLGLATVFSIVQQHQGWINVASEPGRGTTFDIYFPRLIKAPDQPAAAAPTLATMTGGKETILLVEDDDALRASVHRCLSGLGYRLLEAASGAAALRIWHEHRGEINLLLSDLIMPGGMTGRELGERLQEDDPKLKLVFVSGYSADIFKGDITPRQGVKFLAKPFAAQALAETVRACLDEK